MRAVRADLETRWQGLIYSSLEGDSGPAHTATFGLVVQPPLQLEVEVKPQQFFPGEEVDLQLVVHNADAFGRVAEELIWVWPEGLSLVSGGAEVRWPKPLAVGQRDTLQYRVQVEPQDPGILVLRGRAGSAHLSGSPVPEIRFQVAAVPRVRLSAEAAVLEVGKSGRLVCEWFNPGAESMALAELRVDIPDVFEEIVLAREAPGASVVKAEGGRGGYIALAEVGVLGPGQSLKLEVQVKPLRPGPFPWKSSFRPAGHSGFIPLVGETVVQVVRGRESLHPDESRLDSPTDLQLMSQAFEQALERELSELPLSPETRIYLQPYDKSDENWVVEDVLTQVLMRRGYQITLRSPAAGAPAVGVMYYRRVDSRIVYTPLKKGWNLFSSGQQREVYGDLFLHLEVVKKVVWARRIRARLADQVPTGNMELLGGSDVIERTVVEPDHKMIERSLSASIIGGLLYIFFAP